LHDVSGARAPVVETKTDLDVKRLTVNAVKPTGNRCED